MVTDRKPAPVAPTPFAWFKFAGNVFDAIPPPPSTNALIPSLPRTVNFGDGASLDPTKTFAMFPAGKLAWGAISRSASEMMFSTMSIAFWFRIDETPINVIGAPTGPDSNIGCSAQTLMEKQRSWSFGATLCGPGASGPLTLSYRDTGGSVSDVGHLKVKVWQHAAVTRSATAIKLYFDGKLASTVAPTQPIAASTTGVMLGRLVGGLDDVRIWNKELSAADVTAVFNDRQ